jgi:hypothetical protein
MLVVDEKEPLETDKAAESLFAGDVLVLPKSLGLNGYVFGDSAVGAAASGGPAEGWPVASERAAVGGVASGCALDGRVSEE